MAGENVNAFDDSNFESDVLGAEMPVLVDFWAEWCGPCHMLTPIVTELADEYQGKVKVGKVDVDKAPQTATRFGIQNIPTVLFFDKGEVIEKFVGVRQKRDYVATIEAKLGVAD